MSEPYKIEPTSRKVIEHKLLTALEDPNVAACLFSKQDLEDLIHGLTIAMVYYAPSPQSTRWLGLKEGMERLLKEAFP